MSTLDLTHTTEFWSRTPREPRVGIMLHYDQSATDAGGLEWLLRDARAGVSYHEVYTRSGIAVPVAPWEAAAWHAGGCRRSAAVPAYSHGNSAWYGLAVMAHDEGVRSPREHATERQLGLLVERCCWIFRRHRWKISETRWRITGHADEAWPRGRRSDPYGPDPAAPVLSVADVQWRVLGRLIADLRAEPRLAGEPRITGDRHEGGAITPNGDML